MILLPKASDFRANARLLAMGGERHVPGRADATAVPTCKGCRRRRSARADFAQASSKLRMTIGQTCRRFPKCKGCRQRRRRCPHSQTQPTPRLHPRGRRGRTQYPWVVGPEGPAFGRSSHCLRVQKAARQARPTALNVWPLQSASPSSAPVLGIDLRNIACDFNFGHVR
jgi:hypothetical protein